MRRILVGGCAAILSLLLVSSSVQAQSNWNWTYLDNPNWNIQLTDFGYSDYLFDNTPGFEGREYLSGEWGAAVGYTVNNHTIKPTWLEPEFSFPNWNTNSNFAVVSPTTVLTTASYGNTSITSTIANNDLRIVITAEMLDTVTGMKLGNAKASATTGAAIDSNRYVLKQTYTITNISGEDITGLNFFQFLHGLNSTESLYDNRAYASGVGTFGEYRYDTTQSGVDASWSGSGATFRDYISFGSKVAPVAVENGYFGSVDAGDDHSSAKPSVGVHLSVEDDALTGVDYFSPSDQYWVGGAQKYALGLLADGQTKSFDVMLSIKTGTVVSSLGDCDEIANGGDAQVGGVRFRCNEITKAGSFFAEFDNEIEADELDDLIEDQILIAPTFQLAGKLQLFRLDFDGEFDGLMNVTLHYDETLLPPGFDENNLAIYHYTGGEWVLLNGVVDPVNHTITFDTDSFSPFGVGALPEPSTIGLAGIGLVGLAVTVRRRRRAA